jgi:amidase
VQQFLSRPEHDFLKAEINYQLLLQSVMQSGMSDEEFKHIEDIAANLEPGDDSVEAILAKGTVLSHRNWIRQNYAREQIKISWSKFFEDWDLIICPQLATTAIEHNHKKISERTITVDNQEQRYFQQIFWPGLAVNAHLPSTVFPTGLSTNNMPIGLQAIGGLYEDKKTIKFTELFEDEFKSFVLPNLEETL